MHIVLYQPDIPQNTGSLIRLCACLDVTLHLIEPCGFLLDDKALRRVAMDYQKATVITRHRSWEAFTHFRAGQAGRLLLLTTRATSPYHRFAFCADDMLLLGRESAGVPDSVHEEVDASLRIPLHPAARSLNVALAAAMVVGEALRQTGGFME